MSGGEGGGRGRGDCPAVNDLPSYLRHFIHFHLENLCILLEVSSDQTEVD